ncbi:hypothetical protein BKP35_04190 [Anaerobacillus arseniciselenatis]|uniref:Uncharacterized protein n=1 Tax=Anaerobacillus arseniciselenatis TaxID=85682 RepID=A0A1S2LV27_9BACI|nr:hypothetical protein [Anaerobacillus arseniciselenatis]OIJ16184.1 hypothetical protein BKP35_04190 [Anaerobacillus arseniciselenatis]
MLRKVVVAVGIFTILFVVAWWANEINEKRYYTDDRTGQIEPFVIDGEDTFERFRPREYIKIQR